MTTSDILSLDGLWVDGWTDGLTGGQADERMDLQTDIRIGCVRGRARMDGERQRDQWCYGQGRGGWGGCTLGLMARHRVELLKI